MRFRFYAAALSLPIAAGVAHAQKPPEHITELRFELSPAIGETLLDTEGNEPVDESEAALSMRIVRPVSKTVEIQLTPALAYSPQVYDDGDPSSQARIGIEVRRRFALSDEARPLPYTSTGRIIAQMFGRYTPSVGFADAFGKHSFFDNTFATGVRFSNDFWFHCRQRWIIELGVGCNPERKLAFEVLPSLNYVLSDDPTRRRFTPRLDNKVVLPLRDLNIRLATRFESRRFTDLRLPTGEGQRDGRISATVAFDFAPAIPKLRRLLFGDETGLRIVNDFTLELGARYVRNRSNIRTKNFDRVFFVPAVAYTRQLD